MVPKEGEKGELVNNFVVAEKKVRRRTGRTEVEELGQDRLSELP